MSVWVCEVQISVCFEPIKNRELYEILKGKVFDIILIKYVNNH